MYLYLGLVILILLLALIITVIVSVMYPIEINEIKPDDIVIIVSTPHN